MGESVSVGALTAPVYACDPVRPWLSVAVTVKLKPPAAVGVPLMLPALDSVNPAGRLPPVTANVYGPMPPLAVRMSAYDTPTAGDGRMLGEIAIAGATTVSV